MHKFLAVDIGASGGRTILGSYADDIVSLREISRFPNGMTAIHGRYHWDIFHIFENIKTGIKDAFNQNEIPESVGIDTWGVDYGLLDKAGHILELPYAYRDHRTDGIMKEFFKILPKEKLYELTGIQFLQFNTIFQLYAAVRDKLPIMDIAEDLLFIPDLLNYLLSGVKKSEFTFATTSQMFNPKTGTWAPEIFKNTGIKMEIMQDIVKPGTIIGRLTKDIMGDTGMPEADVIAVASHDTGSAIAAIPAVDENFAYISSGTWSLMGIESIEPIISAKSPEYNFTNEGGVDGTFRVLKNIMGLWLLQECRRIWAQSGKNYEYPELIKMAASARPFKTLIDPDHSSLLNPENMPNALSALAGRAKQPAPENAGEFARCIFESLAFRYRQTLEELKQVSGKDIRRIHIIGGGSQNELLCRFTANATGLPVTAGPAEGTSLGNIMVQAMAKGLVTSLTEIRRVITRSFEFREYFPENTAEWNENYSRFQDVCSRLKK